jgi:hypothetical protein
MHEFRTAPIEKNMIRRDMISKVVETEWKFLQKLKVPNFPPQKREFILYAHKYE